MPYLKDEIKNLNRNKKIKIRLNSIVDGYSIFLEYNKDYKREKKYLNLQIGNKQIISKKDKETLYKAEILRDKREFEYFGKQEGFELQSKVTHADFLEYFEALSKKKNLPSYHGSLEHLKTFTKQYLNMSNLKFNAIDPKFCTKFKEYLLSSDLDKKLAIPTAKTYLSVFAATLNQATYDNIIPINPAAKIRIKGIESKIEFLSEEELKQFIMVDKGYNEIQNAFIFASQTSMRLGDIRALEFADIRHQNETDVYLYFRQQKTQGVSNLKLSKLAIEIYNKQKTEHHDEKFVFHLPRSVHFINEKLRFIATLARINKHIHFHVSRHTWATLAIYRGVDIYTVSKIMGHSSVAVTEIYANLINKKSDEVADIINIEVTEEDREKKKALDQLDEEKQKKEREALTAKKTATKKK